MIETNQPSCLKCKAVLPVELFNTGKFSRCPSCNSKAWIEAFPNYGRKPNKGAGAELSVGGEEARCFYHEARKAVEVCEVCGRFLCGLCDCALNNKHYCPGCLESGKSTRRIVELDASRTLYGRTAFWLAIVPLYVTGIIAVFIALRYRRAPLSIVTPQRWMFPAALALGGLQTIAYTILIVSAMIG